MNRHAPSMSASLDRSSSQTPRSSSFSPTYGKSPSTLLADISTLSASSSFSSSSSLFGSVKRNGSSAPLKSSSKSYTSILIPSVAVGKKKLSISEPASPHVTCLGRIRIKESGSFASSSAGKESKDVHKSEDWGASQTKERRIKSKDAGKKSSEEVGCFSGRMRRSSATKDALILDQTQIVLRRFSSSVNVETRRDRGSPFTGYLDKPRLQKDANDRDDMEQQEYIPAVPPPNSLLLMRDMKRKENLDSALPHLRMHLRTSPLTDCPNNKVSNPTSRREAAASTSLERKSNKGASRPPYMSPETEEIKTVPEPLPRRKDPAPLSERENNTIQEEVGLSKEKCTENCGAAPLTGYIPSGLALWQRRAIAELSAIDVRRGNQIQAGGMRGMQSIPLIHSN